MAKNGFLCIYAMLTSTVLGLIGFNSGLVSGPIVPYKELAIPQRQFEGSNWILVGSTFFILLMIARTSDNFSRCWSVVTASMTFFIGHLLMWYSINDATLLFGRFLSSIALGYAIMMTTIYIAEISPASSRGKLTSLPEVFFSGGTFLGYLTNYTLSKTYPERVPLAMLLSGAIFVIFLAIILINLPESPRWLAMQGYLDKAKQVLDAISDSREEATHQLTEIKKAAGISDTQQSTGESMWTRSAIHMLLLAIALHFLQQTSGIDTVLSNPRVLEMARLTDQGKKLSTAMTVHLIKTIAMVISTFFLLDRVGRRWLILISIGGMVFSLATLGACLSIIDDNDTKVTWVVYMSYASEVLYIASYSVGLRPVASIYSAEIFPLKLRAMGCTIGILVDQVISDFSSSAFFWLCKAINFGGAAFLFAVIAGAMWVFFYMLMPETQGHTLEEIGLLFGGFTKWRTAERELEMRRINRADRHATTLRPSSRTLPPPSDD